jgi:hypothetical protein
MSWKTSPELIEAIEANIFIGDNKEDLKTEIKNNTSFISINSIDKSKIKLDDLLEFYEALISKKSEQIKETLSSHRMIFYTWFDEQASQLRFSLISDSHEKLPFGAAIISTDLAEIITMFLDSEGMIPFIELEIFDSKEITLDQEAEVEAKVKVFKKIIP